MSTGKPMRVVHFVTAFPRHEQDVITPWLGEILLALRQSGAEVSVMAPAYCGAGDSEWRGIMVRRFRMLREMEPDARWTRGRQPEAVPWLRCAPGFVVGGMLAAWRIARERPT